MSHYRSNPRDVEFNLFEFLGRQEIQGLNHRAGREKITSKLTDLLEGAF